MIADLLHKVGFTDVDQAHDGHTALEQLHRKSYGLVLSDWEMHPMRGDEFVKTIRRDPSLGRTPIILITATGGRGASFLAGADAYLTKPFNEADLQSALKTVLNPPK
jgi:two-component system chemotaxis response regulator CheY